MQGAPAGLTQARALLEMTRTSALYEVWGVVEVITAELAVTAALVVVRVTQVLILETEQQIKAKMAA